MTELLSPNLEYQYYQFHLTDSISICTSFLKREGENVLSAVFGAYHLAQFSSQPPLFVKVLIWYSRILYNAICLHEQDK